MKAIVVCNEKGRIIAVSRQQPAEQQPAETEDGGGVLSIRHDPDAGQLVYELDLPEGMEKESNLIGRLQVDLSDRIPRLVRVSGDRNLC